MRTPSKSTSSKGHPLVEPLRQLHSGGQHDGCGGGIADGPAVPGGADVSISVERSPTGSVLRVAGELDGNTCSLLEAMLEHLHDDSCGRRIELDLSDVSSADSQGLEPALSPNTLIKTASAAVRHTLRALDGEKAVAQ